MKIEYFSVLRFRNVDNLLDSFGNLGKIFLEQKPKGNTLYHTSFQDNYTGGQPDAWGLYQNVLYTLSVNLPLNIVSIGVFLECITTVGILWLVAHHLAKIVQAIHVASMGWDAPT